MGNIKLGTKEVSIGDILLAVGGLIMFICLFLTWAKYTVNFGLGPASTTNISGLNFLKGEFGGLTGVDYAFVSKIPLIAAILGILAIVAAVLPMFLAGNPGKITKHVGSTLAIIAFVFCLIALIKCGSTSIINGTHVGAESCARGVGCILAFIASIVAAAGGILNVVESIKK